MSQLNRTNSISSIDLNESIDASIESARAAPPRRGSLRSARGAEDNPYLRKQGNSSDNLNLPEETLSNRTVTKSRSPNKFRLAKRNPF